MGGASQEGGVKRLKI